MSLIIRLDAIVTSVFPQNVDVLTSLHCSSFKGLQTHTHSYTTTPEHTHTKTPAREHQIYLIQEVLSEVLFFFCLFLASCSCKKTFQENSLKAILCLSLLVCILHFIGSLSRVYPAAHPVTSGMSSSPPATLKMISGWKWMDGWISALFIYSFLHLEKCFL